MNTTACLLFSGFLLLAACNRSNDKELNTREKIVTATMENITGKENVDSFFARYEENFNNGLPGMNDPVKAFIKSSFAACFVESSPVGVMCMDNNDYFLSKVEHGFAFYKKIGTKSMHLTAKDIKEVDALHYLVKVSWRYAAVKKDGSDVVIDFNTSYLLTNLSGNLQIVAYATGDEQKALKENGLID